MQRVCTAVLLAVVMVLAVVQAAPTAGPPSAVRNLLDARDELRTEILRILDLHKVPHTLEGRRGALNKIIQLQPTDSIDTIMMMSVLHQLLATFPGGPFE